MQLLCGYSAEGINEFIIKLSLNGIARLNPHEVEQAQPITIYKIVDSSNTSDQVYWCLFPFFLFARNLI